MKTLAPDRKFKIFQILDYDAPETNGYSTPEGMQGINIDLHWLDQNVIEQTQAEGKTLAIWYWTETESETTKVYDTLFGATGNTVDYFFSDNPLKAMEVRN